MHSESDNIQIMINDEADEVIKNFFDTLKNRPPNNLESMKGSSFVSWLDKKQKSNSKGYNKWFQFAVTVALNHEEIAKHAERITKIKPFIS